MTRNRPVSTSRREFIHNAVLGAAAVAIAGSAFAQAREIPPLVSPDWLSKNLADPRLVILDIRNAEQYKKGHIPGAVNAPMNAWAVSKNGLMLELPSEGALQDAMGRAGIDAASHVVVVNRTDTDFNRADEARVAWTCIVAGIPNVSVLDGGHNRWVREIKKLATETSEPAARKYAGRINTQMLATRKDVLAGIGKAIIVDARVPEEYFGIPPNPGHIKSAVNLPAPWIFAENGTFRKEEDLKAMALGVIGPDQSKEVILYCGSGGYAAAWWFLLTQVFGYRKVRVYDGSMEEWLQDPDAPLSRYSWNK